MKKILKKLTPLLIALPLNLFAQTNGRDFKAVDDYVKSLGPLDSMSMGTINNVVSKKFDDKIDRARAIYDWIAANITYDVKAARSNNTAKNSPAEVLVSRRAVGAGFANLFQDMCSSADIRCLTVNGFAKTHTGQIKETGTEVNHTWAVVQLGESPDTWYYVDPAWGSGYTDPEMKVFTKSFSDGYFFSDKSIFNLQHYPDNQAWKLGSGAPKSKKDFYELPVVKVAAQEYGMKKFTPNDGIVKVKASKAISFNYTLDDNEAITKVSLVIGERKKIQQKDIPFAFSSGVLSFTHKFDEGSFPVTVLINGKELISYVVEAD